MVPRCRALLSMVSRDVFHAHKQNPCAWAFAAGPMEREYELLIRSTLEGIIPLAQHPRTSIMVVLQVRMTPGRSSAAHNHRHPACQSRRRNSERFPSGHTMADA